MSLIEKNMYLFVLPYPYNDEKQTRENIKEFLKADDLKGNMFINIIYDIKDYQEYR